MGAKTNSTQNSVSKYTPTPQAAGLYTDVINQAQAAQSPYNPATRQNVAGFNDTQTQAFGNIAGNASAWQPGVQAGANTVNQSAQGIGAADIAGFYNPYQQDVINATMQQQGQQDALARRAYTANEAAQGGLGGSGFHIGKAQLQGQQSQNSANTLANLNSQGYAQALAAAQQQKQQQLASGNAQAGIGQLTSQLGYNDAAQQLASGNQQQAQQQNVNNAASTNATNEQLYPMQQAQWLASLASGIGPLTGGTTATNGTASQSQGKGIGNIIGGGLTLASMASDERVKENEQVIGKTFDGQPIYKFNYQGDPRSQIGLMAQDVERGEHPEAVAEGPGGVKMVNYDQALQGAYADGGGIGTLPQGLIGWADLKPAQVQFPSAPQMSAPSGGSEGEPDYAAMGKGLGDLGKMAGFGMPSQLPSASSPAGGALAASGLQDGAAGGFGGGIGGLMSMFGFADGGAVDDPYYKQARRLRPRVIQQESGGDHSVVSSAGARGIMQVMPETGRDPGFGVDPLRDDSQAENERFGTDYLAAMLRRHGGDERAALIAYNGGPKRADTWLASGRDDSKIPAESANYYRSILGEGGAALVAKGQRASSEQGEGYTGKADKASGGMLKRMFGVDFNPLGLNENERRALMVAGLSMLSSGDVGKGGLAGLSYLTGVEASEKEAGSKASALAYQMSKDEKDLALRTRGADLAERKDTRDIAKDEKDLALRTRAEDRQAAGAAADTTWREGEAARKAAELTPDQKEYEAAKKEGYTDDFVKFKLDQKRAGVVNAQLPAEVGARNAMGKTFVDMAPEIEKRIQAIDKGDRANLAVGRGRVMDLWRDIETGREVIIRSMTGAGMSEAEAKNSTARYQIEATDTHTTMLDKVRNLKRDVEAVMSGTVLAKTGDMARQFKADHGVGVDAPKPVKTMRFNAQTGEIE